MLNHEKGIFHPDGVRGISEVCKSAILKEWLHPCIAPAAESGYENANETRSSFIVQDGFVGDYRVTIEKL